MLRLNGAHCILSTLSRSCSAVGRGPVYFALQTWSASEGAAQAAAINAAAVAFTPTSAQPPASAVHTAAHSPLRGGSVHGGGGNGSNVQEVLEVKEEVQEDGAPDPLVAALSAYALPGASLSGTPWPTFAAQGVAFWDSLAATGLDVIPTVAAGWDPRPRVTTPPPWDPNQASRG